MHKIPWWRFGPSLPGRAPVPTGKLTGNVTLPMHLVEAIEAFDAARYRAFRRTIWSAVLRRPRRMAVLRHGSVERQAYRGVQEIPLDRIVGSADSGRPGDLDAGFLPTTNRLRRRWIDQYVLLLEGPELPPIEVRKVGDGYYVIDGHHRVSVYRTAGRATIRARVTEMWIRGDHAAGAPRYRRRAADAHELCWSCGQRNHHKPWCPNR
jgi:hypothetical protein